MTKDMNWYTNILSNFSSSLHLPPSDQVLTRPSAWQVNFLKEFCAFSQTLQPQNRDAFFKTLSNMGILPALEVILVSGSQTLLMEI